MKKFTSLTIVLELLLVVSLSSCQKDKIGVYAPEKKIQRIYYSSNYTDKTPYQHWEWNGDQLNSITHYSDYYLKANTWVESFTYEGKRVKRVDNYTESEYITYEYDGNHLKSATMYHKNTIICTWEASYEGEHISKLTGNFYHYFKNRATSHLNPLSHLLPPDICENVVKHEQQLASQRHQEETVTLVLLLTWTGDDISKIIFTGDGEYVEFQLKYDDKKCPLYGFMGDLLDYVSNFDSGHTGFTKHNITTIIATEGHESDTLRFAYQYDSDKYPVLQTSYFTYDPDEKRVLYYEY